MFEFDSNRNCSSEMFLPVITAIFFSLSFFDLRAAVNAIAPLGSVVIK